MNRALLIAAATGAVLLNATGAAQAAPGDPLTFDDVPAGCYVLGLPPGQTVVCPPTTPPLSPPLTSVCTVVPTLPDEGDLIRKRCQMYDRATGEPVGTAAYYVYPPATTLTAPAAPVDRPVSARSTAPTRSSSAPAVPSPRVPAVVPPVASATIDRAPVATPTPASPAAPTETAFVPNGQGAPLNAPADNRVPYTVAALAGLVLLVIFVSNSLRRRRTA